MKLIKLSKEHLPQVMKLFGLCFEKDSYYSKLFQGEEEKRKAMQDRFESSIAFCIDQNVSIGIQDDDHQLIAFLLCFDYENARNNHSKEFYEVFGATSSDDLPYKEKLHSPVQSLQSKTLYILSIAVQESCRNKGIASAMIDYLIVTYPCFSIVGDVSNASSLPLYRNRGFTESKIDNDYYLIYRIAKEITHPKLDEGRIKVLVPNAQLLSRYNIFYELIASEQCVIGYNISFQEGVHSFIATQDSVSIGQLVSVSLDGLLQLQRLLNLSQHKEIIYPVYFLYSQTAAFTEPPLINETLSEMIKRRKTEWGLVPDIYISVPVQYVSKDLFDIHIETPLSEDILSFLDYRTSYEVGVPSSLDQVDDLATLKSRIYRTCLGSYRIQLLSEPAPDGAQKDRARIGPAALVDLYISLDLMSNCGVLTICSMSSPFLLSHLLDNVSRNQIVISGKEDENLFEFLKCKYDLIKQGTPKAYVVIPKQKDCLSSNQIASLLASETIYPDGEMFGRIIDDEIISIATSNKGMGQYDRASILAYDNVVLQFSPDVMGSVKFRIGEESITLFYIELILFEEAAIHIANRSIIQLLSTNNISEPIRFLKDVDGIYDNYSQTIDFWHIKVNYPTSQKSVKMLRNAFRTPDMLDEFNRNQEYLQLVFDTKCDIIDRKDSKRMDTSLAIISILAVFSALIDGHDYIATWNDLLSGNEIYFLQRLLFVAILITAIYAIAHLFGNRFGLLIQLRREKRKKRTKKH